MKKELAICCAKCEYYTQHYEKKGNVYKPVRQGHCAFSKHTYAIVPTYACENFAPKNLTNADAENIK